MFTITIKIQGEKDAVVTVDGKSSSDATEKEREIASWLRYNLTHILSEASLSSEEAAVN